MGSRSRGNDSEHVEKSKHKNLVIERLQRRGNAAAAVDEARAGSLVHGNDTRVPEQAAEKMRNGLRNNEEGRTRAIQGVYGRVG